MQRFVHAEDCFRVIPLATRHAFAILGENVMSSIGELPGSLQFLSHLCIHVLIVKQRLNDVASSIVGNFNRSLVNPEVDMGHRIHIPDLEALRLDAEISRRQHAQHQSRPRQIHIVFVPFSIRGLVFQVFIAPVNKPPWQTLLLEARRFAGVLVLVQGSQRTASGRNALERMAITSGM